MDAALKKLGGTPGITHTALRATCGFLVKAGDTSANTILTGPGQKGISDSVAKYIAALITTSDKRQIRIAIVERSFEMSRGFDAEIRDHVLALLGDNHRWAITRGDTTIYARPDGTTVTVVPVGPEIPTFRPEDPQFDVCIARNIDGMPGSLQTHVLERRWDVPTFCFTTHEKYLELKDHWKDFVFYTDPRFTTTFA